MQEEPLERTTREREGLIMNRYPCELIEDLLPLYIEGDLSDKSKKIVEEHINHCESCRKLLIEYSDREPILIDIEESLPKADTFKKWMARLKKSAMMILVLFVILGVSIGGISYYIGKSNSPNKHLLYAKNEEDMKEYFYEKTPGLKRAMDEGNVFEINKTVKIPDTNDAMTIDRVWYSSQNIYIFYHLDGEIPIDINGSLIWESGEKDTSFLQNMNIGEGIVYKGKYFSRMSFGNRVGSNLELKDIVDQDLTLQITLRYGDLTREEKQIVLPDIDFKVAFNPEKEVTQRMNLNGKVDLGGYGSLIFDELIIETQASYLTFDYENELNYQIHFLAGTLETDKGEEKKLWIPPWSTEEESPYYQLKFDALDAIPDSLRIKIDGMYLITDEATTFEIPIEEYQNQFSEGNRELIIDKLVGSVNEVDLYLKRLIWDDRGLTFEIQKDIDLSYDNPIDSISTSMISDIYQQERYLEDEYRGWRLPNVVTIRDKYGNQAGEKDYGQRGGSGDNSLLMEIEKEFVGKAKSLEVHIDNLTYRLTGSWIGEIEIY